MNSALQNSFQAAKSQENNANSQRTAADQQRHNGTTAQRHNGKANNTRESLHFNGTNSSRQNNYIHDLTRTRSSAARNKHNTNGTTNTTFVTVQINSRFCYNFSRYSPHPLLFPHCKSSIVPYFEENRVNHSPPAACLPTDTNAHRKSHVSVRYKMDARQHELQSKAKQSKAKRSKAKQSKAKQRRTPLTFYLLQLEILRSLA